MQLNLVSMSSKEKNKRSTITFVINAKVSILSLKPYRATSHWKKIRLKVLNRDAWTCTYCGESANEVDHVYPKSKGGEDTLDNLVAACRRCNIKKRMPFF
jgi:hypothetical protein